MLGPNASALQEETRVAASEEQRGWHSDPAPTASKDGAVSKRAPLRQVKQRQEDARTGWHRDH